MQKRQSFLVFAALLTAGILAGGIPAARGDLDPTFGSGGKVTTDFGGNDRAWAVALQRDGKLVVAGERFDPGPADDFLLARYTARGALDPTFDADGKVSTDFGGRFDYASDVVIQPDGKIIAVGAGFQEPVRPIDFALARYNANGSLDGGFGAGGKVLMTFAANSLDGANAVAVQRDGKIVVAGRTRNPGSRYDFGIARFQPNGALDPSFDGDGMVITPITAADDDIFDLAIQPDGKLVAAGWSLGDRTDMAVARYNADGTLDTSLDGDGIVFGPFAPAGSGAFDIALQRDGKIVLADSQVSRLNPDGTVDRSFGSNGRTAFQQASAFAVELQPDGRILAIGTMSVAPGTGDFGVVRLTRTGSVDSSYGRGGRVSTDFGAYDQGNDAVLGPDGKLAVAGFTSPTPDGNASNFAVARYVAIRFCVVPNVRGKALAAARTALARSTCALGKVKRKYSAKVKRGRVISQRPSPGARLAELAKVNLVLSRGRRR